MSRLSATLTYALLLLWALVCIVPLYWVANTSLKSIATIDKPGGFLPFVDYKPSLESWRFILFDQSENLVGRLANSLMIGTCATALAILASGMAIYGLTRFPPKVRLVSVVCGTLAIGCAMAGLTLPGEHLHEELLTATLAFVALAFVLRRAGSVVSASHVITVILGTRILPPAVLAVPLYVMALAFGLLDTRTAMVFIYAAVNLPVAVWLLLPALGTRATEQEEAAQLDGASHPYVFFTIVLPMMKAAVAATALIVFLLCWNEYLFAVTLTADHALTLPPWAVGQLSMKEAQVGGGAEEIGHLSAATILMMIPALVFSAYVQKHVSRTVFGRT